MLQISWEIFESLCIKLNKKIKYDLDYVLCINSGGLLAGKLLAEYKKKPLVVISARSYDGVKRKDLKVGSISSLERISGKVLIVDDLVDSGYTMKAVVELVKTFQEVKDIKTATLIYKPVSIFKPDFYVKETSKWVKFPYESE